MSTLPAETPRQPSGDGSGSAPSEVAVLAREVRRLAERFRHLSESRLRARVSPDDPSDSGRSRAQAGLALARRLAALGDAPDGREVPDLGVFAVGDQIAVTGLDLAAHLGARVRAAAGSDDRAAAAMCVEVSETALREVRALAALV
ncbi:hypothetical protein [Streptodolium elevatio]